MINIVLCNYFKFLLRHNRRRNLADDILAIVNFAHNTDNGCHEEHTVVYQSNFVRIIVAQLSRQKSKIFIMN